MWKFSVIPSRLKEISSSFQAHLYICTAALLYVELPQSIILAPLILLRKVQASLRTQDLNESLREAGEYQEQGYSSLWSSSDVNFLLKKKIRRRAWHDTTWHGWQQAYVVMLCYMLVINNVTIFNRCHTIERPLDTGNKLRGSWVTNSRK